MIEIDGSIGGGQVLRTAVGLSALTLKPFRIVNIRKNRPKQGLRPQHLTGVKVAGEICGANIKGMSIGSTALEFVPKKSHDFSDRKIDIGTAGSLQLLLQTITPSLIFSDRDVQIQAKGGTAGLGAPTIEYTKFVFFPLLAKLGLTLPDLEILRQGFYPKGGGVIRIRFLPTTKQLKSLKLTCCGKLQSIKGFSIAGNLPESVAQRQADAAKRILAENGYGSTIESTSVSTNSAGTSLTILAHCENSIIAADDVGTIGKRAEKIGSDTANNLISSIKTGRTFDKFMSDQIIPFIALAKGKSKVTIEEYTDHVKANILATEKMLNVKFEVNQKENIVAVEGIGHTV